MKSTDIIAQGFEWLANWIANLDPQFVTFLFRALALYGLAAFGCALLLLRGNRSVVLQVLWTATAAMIAAILPLDGLTIENRVAKTWVLLITVILLAVLPALLARVLVPTFSTQQKLQKILYLILVFLFVANFFGGHRCLGFVNGFPHFASESVIAIEDN